MLQAAHSSTGSMGLVVCVSMKCETPARLPAPAPVCSASCRLTMRSTRRATSRSRARIRLDSWRQRAMKATMPHTASTVDAPSAATSAPLRAADTPRTAATTACAALSLAAAAVSRSPLTEPASAAAACLATCPRSTHSDARSVVAPAHTPASHERRPASRSSSSPPSSPLPLCPTSPRLSPTPRSGREAAGEAGPWPWPCGRAPPVSENPSRDPSLLSSCRERMAAAISSSASAPACAPMAARTASSVALAW
mmetsp:Transcript_25539/g.64805  ORF Transcript_25539/g.64805 Transcript_25539/m.64805 type:complete len:253 (-) Transcript_25539:347-1105(-)